MVAEDVVARLRREVIGPLATRFVGRDEVVDLIALATVAGEHLFLLGPPGTAKSALIRGFASAVQGRYFEYLLTRFSEPNEIFGPVDLARLRDGVVATVTTGMLPEAEFIFLDELFNANSAILNQMLTVLNERVFRRGAETIRLPLLSLFAASNHLAEDEALAALFDRFLIRCRVESLSREAMPDLLRAGWSLEADDPLRSTVTATDLQQLAGRVRAVDLSQILEIYADSVGKVRDLGVGLSDRRAVRMLKLVAASALLCGRTHAIASDLWVLRHAWDRVEQVGPLAALVDAILATAPPSEPGETDHPRSRTTERVDPEDLARQLDAIAAQLDAGSARKQPPALADLARARDRLVQIADRVAWVEDEPTRRHLQDRATSLLDRVEL